MGRFKSSGLKWEREMVVGEHLVQALNKSWPHLCECMLCRTEFDRGDFDNLAKPITGSLQFKDGNDGKK